MKKTSMLFVLVITGLISCKQNPSTELRNDFKKYYDLYNVEGSFLLFDPQANKYIACNEQQTKQPYTPASTFKICNSLIGLETGIIPDEHYIIKWDSITRPNPNWNTDQDLKTAYHNSTVWYYQELARRVGSEKMNYWLNKANYGNADTSGGIDKFWLTGGLRISSEQQIDFLKRLHENKLPFSERTTGIVKKIMTDRDSLNYSIKGKLGWGGQDHKDIGWFVGWLELEDRIYYFSNMVQMPDTSNNFANFDRARKEITYSILQELKLIQK